MAITILPPDINPWLAGVNNLSGGITAALDQLADNKLEQLKKRNLVSNLAERLKGFNITPEQAMGYAEASLISPSILNEIPRQQAKMQEINKMKEAARIAGLDPNLVDLGPQALASAYKHQLTEPQRKAAGAAVAELFKDNPELQELLTEGGIGEHQSFQIGNLALQKQNVEEKKKKEAKDRAFKEEERKIKIQNQIDTKSAPYLTDLTKLNNVGDQIYDVASRMLKDVEAGQVFSGIMGNTPELLLKAISPKSIDFLKDSQELATLMSQGSGVATNMKIKLNLSQKPELNDSKETQVSRLKKLIDKSIKMRVPTVIKNDLISKNNGKIPEGIQHKIEKLYPKYIKVYKEANPAEYARIHGEGTVIESDGYDWILEDGNWHLVGKAS